MTDSERLADMLGAELIDTPEKLDALNESLQADGFIPPRLEALDAEMPTVTLEQRIDYCAQRLNELTVKVDNLTQGMMATYVGVNNLVQMLQAVQQVAQMMPGGRKIAKAMMDAQNGTPNV